MRPPAPPLSLSDGQQETLRALSRSSTATHREVLRARALLLAADGLANTAIAEQVGVAPSTVKAWRVRFVEDGLAGLATIRPGRGRKPSISDEMVAEIVRATLHDTPPGEPHWSCRSMAAAQGVSPATAQRIWSARGLKPHLVETFKLSNDPSFEDKLVDLVGLYPDPPDKAVVLCMDEKSQMQALDCTQPALPMKKGRAGTMTHDYRRNGASTLFAALDVATGKIIGQCLPRHRHEEFLKFLRTIDHEVPKGLEVHLILDNYATHKHPNVGKWMAKHPRFHLHFTPTSSSWLNLVERFFSELTEKALRRGVFASVPELITAVEDYLQATNDNPKPFVWTATGLEVGQRGRSGALYPGPRHPGARDRPRRDQRRSVCSAITRESGVRSIPAVERFDR